MQDNRCNSTSVRHTQYSHNPAARSAAREPLVRISGTVQLMELVSGKVGRPLSKKAARRRRLTYCRRFPSWKSDVARVQEAPHAEPFVLDHSMGRAKRH